ncbi:hypothetical protein D9619_006618 [Psilocybe cf. subviscida]|uniref:Uncharacterized protein n=1 Tax=Psilocybe cf. subviscida TaxID=2480587 RepID=A0A8H5EY07_9AGAR|nr:hypothetical protein D9619_006618 [Psilocybe cf. subviscida]
MQFTKLFTTVALLFAVQAFASPAPQTDEPAVVRCKAVTDCNAPKPGTAAGLTALPSADSAVAQTFSAFVAELRVMS